MTSLERHKARYERRKAKRDEKKRKFLDKYCHIERAASRNALRHAAYQAAKGSRYKESTKRYLMNIVRNDAELSDKILSGKNITKGFICFPINERGKLRHIMSVHFKERVPQKALNQNILIPCMMRSNIYDNGASQADKGASFFHSELTKHLIRHYKKYGPEGYALLIDFHDFFGSADHKTIKQNVFTAISVGGEVFDELVLRTTYQFIDAYKRYNAAKRGIDPVRAAFGLGLGSEVNQTLMVTYPNRIDHFIKEVLRILNFDRYMDDSCLIHISKEYLKKCLSLIKNMCAERGITLNETKTKIVKLSHGFTICKVKYSYGKNGAVIRRPARKKITGERRKLKKQRKMLDDGVLTFDDVRTSYGSWRGGMELSRKKRKHAVHKTFHNTSLRCHRALRSMDKLFNDLFIKPFIEGSYCNG